MQISTPVGQFSADTKNRPSASIWGDVEYSPLLWEENFELGYVFQDNFDGVCPNTEAGLFEGLGESGGKGYIFFGDATVFMRAQPGTSGVGGVLEVTSNATDNDEAVISTGSPAFMVSDTAADAKKLWFEARVKRASIANNGSAMFVGLAWDHGSGVPVAKTLCLTDDDGALGAFSYIGFHVDAANGDAIDFVVKAEGQSQTVILAGADVPVADTYAKLGFKYDPAALSAERIKIYVDGVIQTTFVTGTQISAATFPDAEPLAMVWGIKSFDGAESKAQMSWWRAAQLRA